MYSFLPSLVIYSNKINTKKAITSGNASNVLVGTFCKERRFSSKGEKINSGIMIIQSTEL
ncbi:hypothetical protein GCM10007938_13040 [Vibrio zhanjiangensis]|uniref:Uncharacterized protein n=1 Tax=Vibrio zhanjiangensis TaxID=1046128 RepID=A0ABQ6EWF0_9VIBR|nr:hypothetical protein GCM10007938_13040 [Vibrio zhanjiangensis]